MTERVLVTCPMLRALGFTNFPISLSEVGVGFPPSLERGRFEVFGIGQIPGYVPILGGAAMASSTSGKKKKKPKVPDVPPILVGRCKVTENKLVRTIDDGQNGQFEQWETPSCIKWAHLRPGGPKVWIASCKFSPADNSPSITRNSSGVATEFEYINRDGKTGNVTVYTYRPQDGTRGTLAKKHYDAKNDKWTTEDPTDAPLNPIDPLDGLKYFEEKASLYLCSGKYSDTTWEYDVRIYKPISIEIGDSIKIIGSGIDEAAVIGTAKQQKYGAWMVVEITNDYVIFSATSNAEINKCFSGFEIKSTNAVIGLMPWYSYFTNGGWVGSVYGPVGKKQ